MLFDGQGSLDECEHALGRKWGDADEPTQSKLPTMSLPPITSLSWNAAAPSSVVTCSIDTTATLWDITNQTAVTQLIAHDKAVYDL